MLRRPCVIAVAALVWLVSASPAGAAADVQVAGLQAALRHHGLYAGPIDGIAGPQTNAAVRAFQRRAGLVVDGVAGPATRAALGPLGSPLLGRRVLRRGAVGWDVSVLQFLLSRAGIPCAIDGHFGAQTEAAVRAFQRRSRLAVDGIAGPATLAAVAPGAAAPAPAAASAPPPTGPTHLVRAGENLTTIAGRYATTVDALARANGLDPARVLPVATRLRVPAAATSGPPAGQSWTVRLLIDRWASHYGIDPRLVRALAWQESGFQQHVVSPAGAFGVMQVIPATWEFVELVLLGQRLPRTLENNVRVGTAFLAHLLRLFGGNERLALAAYYRGPEAVRRFGLGPETSRYVANVLALRGRM